jgi:PAS domain S-box-containing protein
MKTHNKITILLIGVVTVLVLFLTGYQYIRNQEIKLYIKSKQISDENVIDKVLEFKDRSYLKSTEDNSSWNDMVDFIKTRDMAWAKENLESILATIDLSYIGIYDTTGTNIISVADSNSIGFNIPKQNLKEYISYKKTTNNYIKYKGYIYEIFGTKIVPSSDINLNTHARGYLISAIRWDKNYVKDVKDATGFNLKITQTKPTENQDNHHDFSILRPMKDSQGNVLAYCNFSKSYQYLNQFKYLRVIIVTGFVILMLIIIGFIYLSNKWIAKPLKEITLYLSNENLEYIQDLLKRKGSFTEIAKLLKLYTEQRNAYLNEIIERKSAEKAIIKQKILFEQLFKNAPIGIIMLDKNERVLDINPEFTKIFKFNIEDVHGQDLNIFLVPKDLVDESHNLSNQTIIGEIVAKETVRRRKDGSLLAVSVYGVPIDVDNERIGIYGMYIDITERHKAALQLETYSNKLKELNVTKDKFFSIIAHDLKSPFNSITGFSELLLDNYSNMEIDEIKTSLKFIQSSSKHAYALLENLLVWARSQTQSIEFKPIVFNLKDGIYDTVAMAESIAAKKQIKLISDIAGNISIFADINMINTVIRNLLSNAIKFTPAEGKIEICVSQNSESWLFSIRDNGVGIDPKNIDKLFKIESKFSTFGTENETGTGLGLILCREFVEKHGGKIWIESTLEKGTEFIFSIPKS